MLVATLRDAIGQFTPLFAGLSRERLAVLYLDGARGLLATEAFAPAAADSVDLPMRAIFRAALGHDARGLILAHNHPGGDPAPSRADIAATHRLAQVGRELGITLHDHLIVANGEWRSFRELGLL